MTIRMEIETVDEGVQLLIIRCTILAITSKRNFGPILNRILYRSRWICAPRCSPFNSITHFERKPRLRGTISATKSVSKYQYWWSFVTLELSKLLSNESYGKQRENGYFYLSVALKRAQLFSFLFPLLSRPAFSSPLVSMFRVRFTRTRNSYFLFRFAERARTSTYTRTSTMGSGGLTHRWPTIASNTSSFAQWFHAPPCTDPRIRIGTKRSGVGSSATIRCRSRRRIPGAYLSDNGQARILKDASTVTTSSMIPNVMYITPRCTRENM